MTTAEAHIRLAHTGSDVEFPVQALRLDRGLAHPVGRAEAVLPAGVEPPDPGVPLRVATSVAGSDVTLLTGEAAKVVRGPDGTRLTILEPVARLNRRAPDSSWSAETAGGVIGALCRDAEVPTGTMLPGITIPHMVLGNWASLLDHAMRLARMSGAALVTATSGALSMLSLALPVPKGPFQTDRAALALGDSALMGEPMSARVTGAGAMGSAGPGMTTLPLQDASLISAGPDDAGVQMRDAGIRMLTDAVASQLAAAQRLAAPFAGVRVTTPLPEDLTPGDIVLAPDGAGLPTRLVRVERVGVTLTGARGILAQYDLSDVRVA